METTPRPRPTCIISQACGIGDILFVQKIAHHFADMGYEVILPILDIYAWMRYYIEPHPHVEYPLLQTNRPELRGTFKFAKEFLELGAKCDDLSSEESRIFQHPILYGEVGSPDSFVFLALGPSYHWRAGDRMMPAKYNLVGLAFSDWQDYVHLKRRPSVERELYYDVLGLKDDSCFTLVNENSSSKSLPLPVPGTVVRMREIEGFTLLDWRIVAERAAQIVTIDTSLVLIAEILKLQKPLYMISRYEPPSFDAVEDILKLKWNLVLTPETLQVPPATPPVQERAEEEPPRKRRFWQRG